MNEKTAFFDHISELWDGWEDQETTARNLAAGLEELGVLPGELVMDLGCGTGNLTLALLSRLSPQGQVISVDISPRMLARAGTKVQDPRVTWVCASVEALPLGDQVLDRVICFSAWPHFNDQAAAARELARVLKPGGALHVWHLVSKERINEIHANAGPAVRGDVLVSGEALAEILRDAGFSISHQEDTDSRYLISGISTGA